MGATIRIAAMLALAALSVAGAAPLSDVLVNIDNFAFSPAEITVAAGTMVVWTNRDDIHHTVTAAEAPPLFKSKPLDTNDHYAHRFDKPGRFAYFCSLHTHMQGMVVVK